MWSSCLKEGELDAGHSGYLPEGECIMRRVSGEVNVAVHFNARTSRIP